MNLHDETTVCDQVEHTLFRAVVGKLQYITGVRPDLMFVTKCLSYKLASPTLADLTRAKKALRYLKGTRKLNLYVPENRVAEVPAVQTTQDWNTVSSACKDILELRTNGVLDLEKIKTWTEAQEQLENLPMRQLYGILEKLPGCKKGTTSSERAVDIVRWLQARSTN